MSDGGAVATRERLLGSFRWTEGHADFSVALRDSELVAAIGAELAHPFRSLGVTAVVGIEARGFVVAGLVARELGVGVVLARKPGSVHPDAEHAFGLTKDWRGRNVEVRVSRTAVRPGDRFLLADDWIQTGSQARTVARLAGRLGAAVIGVTVLVDDTSDRVRQDLNVVGLVRSDDLPSDR